MTDDTMATVDAGLRTGGVEYLRELAQKNPDEFVEVVDYARGESQPDPMHSRGPQVRFIVRQQPGSDNRT